MTCFISVAATVLLIAHIFNEETLLCKAEGNPTPHVTWIGPDGEVKKTSTGEARISLGNLGQGKYTCKATNALGSDQKSYIVTRKDFFWSVTFCLFVCLLLSFIFLSCLVLSSSPPHPPLPPSHPPPPPSSVADKSHVHSRIAKMWFQDNLSGFNSLNRNVRVIPCRQWGDSTFVFMSIPLSILHK